MGWWNMSSERKWLALRLDGPLQSWGFDSQYNHRNTGLMPTKSGIAGMCCAAFGYPRGSDKEHDFLKVFATTRMISVAISRQQNGKEIPVRRLRDYHTIQNTRTADGKTKNCHITYRQYLTDAAFGVFLGGPEALIVDIGKALRDPVWGIWLGRKACIPSSPVFVGIYNEINDAFMQVVGDTPIEHFTRQEDAESFGEGSDTISDVALSFAVEQRSYAPRRVKTVLGI